MHVPPAQIRTLHGFSRLPPPPLIAVNVTRGELHHLVRAIEREADLARADRLDHVADRLDHRAADLREAGR